MIRTAVILALVFTLIVPSMMAIAISDPTYEVGVSGMTCKGCKREVNDLLIKIENVKAVEIDLKTEKATITMKTGTTLDRATVDKALKGSKFSVVSMTEKKAESRPKN